MPIYLYYAPIPILCSYIRCFYPMLPIFLTIQSFRQRYRIPSSHSSQNTLPPNQYSANHVSWTPRTGSYWVNPSWLVSIYEGESTLRNGWSGILGSTWGGVGSQVVLARRSFFCLEC